MPRLSDPVKTVLGPDPGDRRRCILNGNAFQQDAVTSLHGWQYAAFYAPSSTSALAPAPAPVPVPVPGSDPAVTDELYVHLSRRKLPAGDWETLLFQDYAQTTDDGHNTVQLGICAGDGTIHLAWDHHCDTLHYRHSVPNLAADPSSFAWSAVHFTTTLSTLPGQPAPLQDVTYPRFLAAGPSLYLTHRTGRAGLGDDHLYVYTPGGNPWAHVGAHLLGASNSPYVHGLDWHAPAAALHATWVYRAFVPYPGWDDPADTKHKAQAGPNGAENNHDLCHAWSADGGRTWRNGAGRVVGDLSGSAGPARVEGGVRPDAEGIVAFAIPKGSGLMNQEAQAVDGAGGVHVLNRDDTGGRLMWKHYYRDPEGTWTQRAIRPIDGNKRGRLAVTREDDILLLLPDTNNCGLKILRATKESGYSAYEEIWSGHGYTGEPLVDSARLRVDDVLSVFVRADADVSGEIKEVAVLDFKLDNLS